MNNKLRAQLETKANRLAIYRDNAINIETKKLLTKKISTILEMLSEQ